MNDPREFPYILEFAMRTPGAKVHQQQLATSQEVVDGINRYISSGWDVWVHKIQQVSVRDFMNQFDQKNWCHNCQEFIQDSDHAKRCEDLNHHILWKDPRPAEAPLNGPGDTTI